MDFLRPGGGGGGTFMTYRIFHLVDITVLGSKES